MSIRNLQSIYNNIALQYLMGKLLGAYDMPDVMLTNEMYRYYSDFRNQCDLCKGVSRNVETLVQKVFHLKHHDLLGRASNLGFF